MVFGLEAGEQWLLGRQRQAVKGWQASLEAAERMQMVYHQWRAHQALAEHHPEASAASRHRTQADELKSVVFETRTGG
jgi:hypothetical protein